MDCIGQPPQTCRHTTSAKLPIPADIKDVFPGPIVFDDDATAWLLTNCMIAPTIWKSTDQMKSWTLVGPANVPISNPVSLTFMDGKLWCIGGGFSTDATVFCSTSVDGVTWTAQDVPSGLIGAPSLHPTVFNGQICFFVSATNGINKSMALWRISTDGTWTRDTPTPGQTMRSTDGNAICVAQTGGTLFTIGNWSFSPTAGLWARNT